MCLFLFFCVSKTEEIRNKYKTQKIENNNMAYVKENVPQTESSENQASSEEAQKLAEQATDPADSNSDGSKKGV